ncbi:MAG: SET domain-containing protein [Patescibacteria group bacterium]|nr:SET domain-containing protein [Patescibacteria group bacterium]
MLLVRTKIGKSTIHGTGLFAEEDIPIGTVIWKYFPDLDLALSIQEVEKLPVVAQNYIYKHAWLSKKLNKYILSFDNDRFANHSEECNVGEKPTDVEDEPSAVALRNIKKGEEITFNYQDIDSDHKRKLLSGEGNLTESKRSSLSAILQ